MILELNKTDAAAWLEISAPTLDRWIRSGKVQVRRIPNARIGQQSVVVLLDIPDVAPAPVPVHVPNVEPTPQPTESADARFAREYKEATATDSFGNRLSSPEKITALGPNAKAVIPAEPPVQDAAAHWDAWHKKHTKGYGTHDAVGPLTGRPDGFSRSEQQRRRAHDIAVIRASFPRRP